MKFFLFHLMPYPYAPADFDRYETSWLNYPNGLYDPEKGRKVTNEYLDQLEAAEGLGFDGVCVNEHHQTMYGSIPSPNVMAGFLVRRTEKLKIALVGNALPLRDHPLRVAEEVALLDVVSGGRIISGFVRGIGVEYFTFGVDPTVSRERFDEAHDLIIKAWTSRESFAWYGKHYRFRYVNVWPRPYQDPHPPIWVPGFGSPETFKWVAKHRYTFMSVYAPPALTKSWLDGVRSAARDEGYEASPDQLGGMFPIYVAETDEQAHREAREAIMWLYQKGLKHKFEYLFPPGYVSTGALKGMMRAGLKPYPEYTYDEIIDQSLAIIGSPETVKAKLLELKELLGLGVLCGLLQFGNLDHEHTMRSMELFGREVLPALRESDAAITVA